MNDVQQRAAAKKFAKIKNNPVKRTRKMQLEAFQKKLSGLKFLDPACGSGNFLTETYICLRKLENEALRLLSGGEIILGELLNPVQACAPTLHEK